MIYAASRGLSTVPKIIRPKLGRASFLEPQMGDTFLEVNGHFWELSQWLPGVADYWNQPSQERLKAACRALGELHACWQDLAPPGDKKAIGMQLAPAIMDRIWRLQALTENSVEELLGALHGFVSAEWYQDAELILRQIKALRPTFLSELTYWSKYTYRCQYVMRDIWHDHVLFRGESCSGLIDYGAVRIDTVITDLVRMLGSLTKSGPNSDWQVGLTEYQREVGLSEHEISTLMPLYKSSVLLSGVQWIRWLAVDQLQFPGKENFVKQRLSELANGVRILAESSTDL
jgi:Ser/Thr protein kinase RdoA (MazF antagonist)